VQPVSLTKCKRSQRNRGRPLMYLSTFPEKFLRGCARNWKNAEYPSRIGSFQVRSSDQDAHPTAIAAITSMTDQIFGWLSSSQWLVFLILVILLIGVSELAWHIGTARGQKKSEAEKDSGIVRSAVLALLGLLLGFSFAVAAARHEARRELLVEEANSI